MPDCAGRRLAPAAPCCGACPEEPAGAARVLRGRRRAGYNRRPMKTSDLHVESNRPLLPPAILLDELPLGEAGSLAVSRAREEIIGILRGEDDRLIAVVGPCITGGQGRTGGDRGHSLRVASRGCTRGLTSLGGEEPGGAGSLRVTRAVGWRCARCGSMLTI
jgi:hypothetical protein